MTHQNTPTAKQPTGAMAVDDYFKGKWKEFKGKVKEEWGDLTDDDLNEINGKREKLAGRLQARYGWEETRINQELDRFNTKYMR